MPSEVLLLASMFFAAAVLYSSVGQAGASGYLAAMALLGVAPETMKPTALVLNVLVAGIATIRFARAGMSDARLLLPFAVGAVPMAFVGGAWVLPGRIYEVAVGAILLLAALQLLRSAARCVREAEPAPRRVPVAPAIGSGAVIGLLSGLTGTGGGIFLTPLLLFLGWAGTRTAGGVSAAFILLNSLAGLAGNSASVASLPPAPALGLWLVAAGAGGWLGSHLGTRRLGAPVLRRLLAAVLAVAAGTLFVG